MSRRALSRGGTAAVLVLLALYLLLGGELDLGGDEQTTTSATTTTVAAPAGTEGDGEPTAATEAEPGPGQDAGSGPPPAGRSDLSEEESAGIAATLALIESGQPLPHEQDGTSFQNREGLLPSEPEGYYREYTVETPGSSDRGARRLVIGSGGETYYTGDHYGSFVRIDPEQFR